MNLALEQLGLLLDTQRGLNRSISAVRNSIEGVHFQSLR